MGEDLKEGSLPKIILIISAQRHGTTTLCRKFEEVESCVSLYEAFNKGGIFNLDNLGGKELDQYMIKVFKEKKLSNKHTVVIKLFYNHKVNIEDILKLKTDISFIFLKRKLNKAYESYKKAMLTGNWGTTPDLQSTWVSSGRGGYIGKILEFNLYEKKIKNWMKRNRKLASYYKLKTHTIFFRDVISNDFKPFQFL